MNIDVIRHYIQVEILDDECVPIDLDDNLLLTQVLDSHGVMHLVAHIEETVGIEIPPEDVTTENFSSLRQIDLYIAARRDDFGSSVPSC